MFEEIGGLPLHPLLVHATVVFLPLQVLLALAYALVPAVRRATWWAVVLVSIIGPITASLAKLSGEAFEQRQRDQGTFTPAHFDDISHHSFYANITLGVSIGLGVLTLVLVALTRRRAAAAAGAPASASTGAKVGHGVLTVLVVAASVALAFYVYKTGDSGARMVWSGS